MEHSRLFEKLLDELEKKILDYNGEVELIKLNNMEYRLTNEILETLRNSPVDFVITYHNSKEEIKKRIRDLLEKVCSEKMPVDRIIKETKNLFFLHSSDLLDDNDIAPQRNTAIKTLEELERLLDLYIAEKEYIAEEEIESRNHIIEKISSFGTIFGNGTQSDIIDEVESISEILDMVNLTDEEKMTLIISIIEKNTEIYEERVKEHERMISEEIEKNKQEVEEEIEEQENVEENTGITPEQLEEINNILQREKVREKLVRIINDDINNFINVASPSSTESELIEESIALARENMIYRVVNNHVTPEEALKLLYEEYDQTKETRLKLLHEILDETEDTTTSYSEQIDLIDRGIKFYRDNKSLISTLSNQDKEIISRYMFTVYKSIEQRRLLYESKSYDGPKKLVAESAFEIKLLTDLLDSLDKDTDEYKEMIRCASKRISDILECINELDSTKASPLPEKTEDGKLYFLMRNDNKSMFEDDIRPEDINKGISPEYYEDILELLDEIRNRSNNEGQISISPGYNYNVLRKNNVQITNISGRLQVLYIPINKKDSIIVGIMFTDGKRFAYKEQEERLKRYQKELDQLKKSISVEDELTRQTATATNMRIKDSLEHEKRKSSLRKLFDEESSQNTQPVSKRK